MKNLKSLFLAELADIYDAANQLLNDLAHSTCNVQAMDQSACTKG